MNKEECIAQLAMLNMPYHDPEDGNTEFKNEAHLLEFVFLLDTTANVAYLYCYAIYKPTDYFKTYEQILEKAKELYING